MALDGNILGDLMRAKIDEAPDKTDREALFRALGAAVVQHLTTAGVVAVTVTSVTGVTTGVGVSGPGTGTGTIS
jgi:hypothetical protein